LLPFPENLGILPIMFNLRIADVTKIKISLPVDNLIIGKKKRREEEKRQSKTK